jgi:Aromatic-ring-opening dioxygenase LigAB, LigA subunit
VADRVSHYEINSLLFRLKKDAAFRARFVADPAGALAGADLTTAEREAFVRWNPHALNELGGYLHLLMSIPSLDEDH